MPQIGYHHPEQRKEGVSTAENGERHNLHACSSLRPLGPPLKGHSCSPARRPQCLILCVLSFLSPGSKGKARNGTYSSKDWKETFFFGSILCLYIFLADMTACCIDQAEPSYAVLTSLPSPDQWALPDRNRGLKGEVELFVPFFTIGSSLRAPPGNGGTHSGSPVTRMWGLSSDLEDPSHALGFLSLKAASIVSEKEEASVFSLL